MKDKKWRLVKSGKNLVNIAMVSTLIGIPLAATGVQSITSLAHADENSASVPLVWHENTVESIKSALDKQSIKENLGDYVVQWGDTLTGISKATGVSVEDLVSRFQINNANLIWAGVSLGQQKSFPALTSSPISQGAVSGYQGQATYPAASTAQSASSNVQSVSQNTSSKSDSSNSAAGSTTTNTTSTTAVSTSSLTSTQTTAHSSSQPSQSTGSTSTKPSSTSLQSVSTASHSQTSQAQASTSQASQSQASKSLASASQTTPSSKSQASTSQQPSSTSKTDHSSTSASTSQSTAAHQNSASVASSQSASTAAASQSTSQSAADASSLSASTAKSQADSQSQASSTSASTAKSQADSKSASQSSSVAASQATQTDSTWTISRADAIKDGDVASARAAFNWATQVAPNDPQLKAYNKEYSALSDDYTLSDSQFQAKLKQLNAKYANVPARDAKMIANAAVASQTTMLQNDVLISLNKARAAAGKAPVTYNHSAQAAADQKAHTYEHFTVPGSTSQVMSSVYNTEGSTLEEQIANLAEKQVQMFRPNTAEIGGYGSHWNILMGNYNSITVSRVTNNFFITVF